MALLIRNYGFDLNFQLYIFENYFVRPPYDPDNALWLSNDYNPDDQSKNLHEDIEWSKDSSVIAVMIDGKYVFAYDFRSEVKLESQELIIQLLKSRNTIE